jgi:hypothetical protein
MRKRRLLSITAIVAVLLVILGSEPFNTIEWPTPPETQEDGRSRKRNASAEAETDVRRLTAPTAIS